MKREKTAFETFLQPCTDCGARERSEVPCPAGCPRTAGAHWHTVCDECQAVGVVDSAGYDLEGL